ncbi:hypothetical protein B0H66DRAFT_510887 [Apodospora peruviana]|uniref:Acetyl-CoA synthetase-like protein n=1 Tax=Apodospora peruviana TaxID=516989 RepID=A0AAE0IUJ0_9PEZI|nr:hypothetical protein B0H66DRAFT_510887 [Apodospora peruviana]
MAAISGSPPGDDLPLLNTFDFCFSQPFLLQNDFTPAAHRVPRIDGGRQIFVDNNNSGRASLNFDQISIDSRALAAGLLSGLGLNPENTHKLPPTPSCSAGPEIAPIVLIQLPNGLVFAPVLLGVLAAGLTATLVSPALTSTEISWILQNARPQVIVTAKACLGAMKEAISKQDDQTFFSRIPIFTVDETNDRYPLMSGASASKSGVQDWKALLSATPIPKGKSFFDPKTAAARTAVILWSSGTSGRSKGVLLSHHALNFSAASLWHDADFYLGQPQRWLGYVPFYHVFGLCNVLLLAICTGSTVYTMPAFSLDKVLAAIPARKITYLHMAPPVAVMLAKAPAVEPYARRKDFRSVVGSVTGGAPLGHEVVVQVYQRCGFRIRLGYGLSETCSTALQRGITEDEMHAHAGDTGRPHYGVEILIAASDSGAAGGGKTKAAKIDEEGEILVRAPTLMSAYLPIGLFSGARPDMSVTNEAMTPDGYFRTGDVGALNNAGRLRITDRLKELIKVRAYQVAPAELEAVLCSSEAVADAGVVGVYDGDEATEWPRAFVVPAAGKGLQQGKTGRSKEELVALAGELKSYVEERTAKYKWLKGGIVFVDQIPKSPSGKILRRVLRDTGGGKGGVEVQLYEKKRRAAKL